MVKVGFSGVGHGSWKGQVVWGEYTGGSCGVNTSNSEAKLLSGREWSGFSKCDIHK